MENVLCGPPGYDIPDISYGQHILNQLRNTPPRVIQIDAESGEILTNRDLLKQSIILARELKKRNINFGNTIAISSENSINYFVAVCAAIFAGACVSPMNPAYLKDEIQHCLNISKPQIIFVSRRTIKLIHQVVKTLSWKIKLIQLDNESIPSGVETIHTIINNCEENTTHDIINHYEAEKIPQPARHEVVILYSSGTTGLPKAVMLSSRNLLALWYAQVNEIFCKDLENSVFLMLVPFFHGYGFSSMIFIIAIGGQAIIMKSFQPDLFCASIEKFKVTTLPLAPPIMVFLAKHPLITKYNFDSVKSIICGAAPLSIDIHKAVLKRFHNKIQIRIGYGMTELTIAVAICPYDTKKIGTIGCLVPGIVCKVIDPETSKSLGQNKTGELCFKGDFVMLGYKNNCEATNQMIDRDGWLHTGDLGYYDDDNYLYIVDRLKELIKFNGFQISPSEIENLLLSHNDIDDAAVCGKDHESYGQIPVAFVVLKANATVTPQELCQYVNDRISPQKHLRGGVIIVKSIPKNNSGKILRRELTKLISKL